MCRELWDELVRSHDRSGDEMGEEGEVQEQVDPARDLEVAAVDVHDVGDRHERVERDPHRQHDLDQGRGDVQPERGGGVRDVDGEEAVVLEVEERSDRRGDAERQGHGSAIRPVLAIDGDRRDLSDQGHGRKEEDVPPVPPAVEDVARRDHEWLPHPGVVVQPPVAEEDQTEEDREIRRGEEHRAPDATPRIGRGPGATGTQARCSAVSRRSRNLRSASFVVRASARRYASTASSVRPARRRSSAFAEWNR